MNQQFDESSQVPIKHFLALHNEWSLSHKSVLQSRHSPCSVTTGTKQPKYPPPKKKKKTTTISKSVYSSILLSLSFPDYLLWQNKRAGTKDRSKVTPTGLRHKFTNIYIYMRSFIWKFAGKDSFTWLGPTPRLNIMNPDHIKDILSNMYDFEKPSSNPLVRLLASGLANYEGRKWATHRKIINPAFHLEKLKVISVNWNMGSPSFLNLMQLDNWSLSSFCGSSWFLLVIPAAMRCWRDGIIWSQQKNQSS